MIPKRFALHAAAATAVAVLSAPVHGQEAADTHHHAATAPEATSPDASPYAGMEDRPVKALSEQQMADLKAGHGMGLALPAELNGYPGPRHVLDLADQLQLSAQQRSATRELFDAMRAETIAIGERIIADEATLDRLFARHQITPEILNDLTARIGAAQGELRAAHLRYHLRMMDVLSRHQVAHYMVLRGYGVEAHHMEGMP